MCLSAKQNPQKWRIRSGVSGSRRGHSDDRLPHKEAMGWVEAPIFYRLRERLTPFRQALRISRGRTPHPPCWAESCAAGKQLAEWRVGRSANRVEEIIRLFFRHGAIQQREFFLSDRAWPLFAAAATAELAGHLNQVIRRELDAP